MAALFEAEQRLFAARWRAYDGAVAVQQTKISQSQEQLSALAAQRTATTTKLRATREELAAVSHLLAQGLAPRPRHWELQRQQAELEGLLGQLASQEAQAREAIAQARAELATIGLNRQQDVAKDLGDVQATLADAAQRLRGAQDILERREVTAPEPGTVTDIKFFTPGSSIGAGQPILDLVPEGGRLVAEVPISLNDIEQVRVGQQVNIRLTSYRQHDLPLIPGRLIYVSADRQEDGHGNVFFLARAEMDAGFVAGLGEVPMAAGMPTEVYVLGERRTALDYLLRPLRDELRRSLRD
jgi:HlyD family secretion protein